jgi:hypothetical protein
MDLSYCWLISVSAAITVAGVIVLLATKSEFDMSRAGYWLIIVGSTVLGFVLVGGLVQHILLQLREK